MKYLISIMGLSIALVVSFLYVNPESLKQVSKDFFASITPSADTTAPQPLSEAEITKLVQSNMHNFSYSVKQKEMSQFYKNISIFWQKKTSVKKLSITFKPFIDSNIDLTVLDNLQPIFNHAPILTKNADLYVAGYYDTTPSRVQFKQTYYMQGNGEWKLAEFFVGVKKP